MVTLRREIEGMGGLTERAVVKRWKGAKARIWPLFSLASDVCDSINVIALSPAASKE